MSEKIIDEVMELVEQYGIEAAIGKSYKLPDMRSNIRAKLREVLERKPMPREEMLKLAYPIRWDDLDDREQAAAIGFGRAVEIYHGISHNIGAE